MAPRGPWSNLSTGTVVKNMAFQAGCLPTGEGGSHSGPPATSQETLGLVFNYPVPHF